MNKANLITFLGICLSWIAIILIFKEDYYFSILMALVAFIVDCLDGFVARKFSEESKLGRELDSFSDLILFIVWPALYFYNYFGLTDLLSLSTQFVFIVSGVFRLARFNVVGYTHSKKGKGYPGLPVVFSFLLIYLLLFLNRLVGHYQFNLLSNAIILIDSFLMVRNFHFPKPKTQLVILILLVILFLFLLYGKDII